MYKDRDKWHVRGLELIIDEKYKEAGKAFKKALKIDKTYVVAWSNLGTSLIKQ